VLPVLKSFGGLGLKQSWTCTWTWTWAVCLFSHKSVASSIKTPVFCWRYFAQLFAYVCSYLRDLDLDLNMDLDLNFED